METKPPSLSEAKANEIIKYIIDHKMMPGDKLPTEAAFLTILNVSRSTLREAFRLLIARNILEVRQGSGTFVSPKRGIPDDPLGLTFIYDDNQLVLDMLDVRLMFEPEVASLAATYATRSQLEEIAAQAKEMEACISEGRSYAAADSRFHRLVAEASGNRVIENLTYILNASVAKNIEITLDAQRESNTIYYHRRILKALKERNVKDARHAMTMHLSLLRDFIMDKIAEEREANGKRPAIADLDL